MDKMIIIGGRKKCASSLLSPPISCLRGSTAVFVHSLVVADRKIIILLHYYVYVLPAGGDVVATLKRLLVRW